MIKKKVFVFSVLSLSLSGCSEFYSYQPPAPVYGRSATNPYETEAFRSDSAAVVTEPLPQQQPRFADKQEIKPLDDQVHDSSRYQQPVVEKKPTSPAVLALLGEAEKSSQDGDLESAVVTIERALRIDSRNPLLTYKLAQLRLKQSKPRLAEDLAKKAALLSYHDTALKRSSWLLISEARRRQKNYYGAKQAKLKADSLQ